MELYIEFLDDLATDLFYDKLNVDGKTLFTSGGCYEFYKLIKIYFPSIVLYERNDYEHCAFKYFDDLYDANGKVTDVENYHIATKDDENMIKDKFGKHIKSYNIVPIMCEELAEIDTTSIFEAAKQKSMKI